MPFDTNQLVNNQAKTFKDMLNALKAGFWVALPCVVDSYDSDKVTIKAQPTIRIPMRKEDGTISMEEIPLLQDVPVMFTRGGGCVITHPIKKGDECLVVFADRNIDVWWQNGGIQNPFDNRKHDLSDGFAFFGPQSQPNRVKNISTDALQIRTDDGDAFIELNPETLVLSVKASSIKLDTSSVAASKNLSVGTGATGTFTSATGQIITVADGIIIGIT